MNKIKYISEALTQSQILAEFIWDQLNESCEPFMALLEAIKVYFKFKDYFILVQ